ncbi:MULTISPECIES: hypothetical protein [Okeania]|uniref:hypothetical protein n=1 Tax=Okeania TaxID=1458928 RepID=UPI000F546F38|nr:MULTISPECIES: hypothetical protein [Okeania]NEP04723.1 hypothetical protein [Okeania sp. SIO4D6]NEP38035.1 hypothetical protein [Okeania sp. SIO2H7]NET11952.1 hypothetical protein [Okeania sp. SIO1H6]NEP71427.1 hypothetical protein [Okeania sp. SIO2G5]NEP96081.1 hypothetical protein [Okeania sp. SIO2F5]
MVSQLIIEYPDNFPDAIGQTPEAFEQEVLSMRYTRRGHLARTCIHLIVNLCTSYTTEYAVYLP